jgi:hypothetical protein
MVAVLYVMIKYFGLSKGSLKWDTETCYLQHRLKIVICYRDKRHLPLRDRCYCLYELVLFFRLTGSKHFQYLRTQPSEYAGWCRAERERQGGKLLFGRE